MNLPSMRGQSIIAADTVRGFYFMLQYRITQKSKFHKIMGWTCEQVRKVFGEQSMFLSLRV